MSDKIRDEQTDFLFKAILTLGDLDECYAFFEDLCTVSEIREMAKRLTAARMLNKNYIYSEIAEQTGLSTATIAAGLFSSLYMFFYLTISLQSRSPRSRPWISTSAVAMLVATGMLCISHRRSRFISFGS